MKKLMCLIAILMCVICLSACGIGSYKDNYASNSNPNISIGGGENNNNNNNTNNGDETKKQYTASLYYKNAPFVVGDSEVYVVWQKTGEQVMSPVDQNGKASAGELDGDYSVYLQGLPKQYSYNANGYSVTADSTHVDIIIVDITKPRSGDGSAIYQSGGVYVVNKQGTYRASCTNQKYLYYEYTPSKPGIYSIESWVSVYDDDINPMLEIWSGSVGWKTKVEERDDGGAKLKGGYTKNFRWEVVVSAQGIGQCFTFGIKAESKSGKYPVNVDFAINFEGDYSDSNEIVQIVEAQEIDSIPKTPEAKTPYVYADMGSKLFDGRNFKYDAERGLWRVFDANKYAQTDGWGPNLCVEIKKAIPCYSVTTLYNANKVGETAQNLLQMFDWSDEYNGVIAYDYESFIRTQYASKCNSAGVCYVTQEMKEFLQLFAVSHNLWTDQAGPSEGSPESKGYSAIQDDLWLFACGYYIG